MVWKRNEIGHYIRALNPNLNRDGGRYNLQLVWDNIIKKKMKVKIGQSEEEGLVITVSHNVPNDIAGMLELKKLAGVSESFCELNICELNSWVLSGEICV